VGHGREDDDLGISREGTRQQGGDVVSGDVYGMFFTGQLSTGFKLSKEEFALLKEQEEEQDKKKKEAEEEAKASREGQGQGSEDGRPAGGGLVDWVNLTTAKPSSRAYLARHRLGSLQGRREALLPDQFEKGNDIG